MPPRAWTRAFVMSLGLVSSTGLAGRGFKNVDLGSNVRVEADFGHRLRRATGSLSLQSTAAAECERVPLLDSFVAPRGIIATGRPGVSPGTNGGRGCSSSGATVRRCCRTTASAAPVVPPASPHTRRSQAAQGCGRASSSQDDGSRRAGRSGLPAKATRPTRLQAARCVSRAVHTTARSPPRKTA